MYCVHPCCWRRAFLPPKTDRHSARHARADVISVEDCERTHIDVRGICQFICNKKVCKLDSSCLSEAAPAKLGRWTPEGKLRAFFSQVIYILPREQRVGTGKENQVPATTDGAACRKCTAPMHQADAIYCSLQCKACRCTQPDALPVLFSSYPPTSLELGSYVCAQRGQPRSREGLQARCPKAKAACTR